MQVEDGIQIDMPKTIVWSVTEDVQRWPEWTPFVQTVKLLDDGLFDVGSTALIKQPGLPEAKWRVTALSPGESFTWETRVFGIRMVATHELKTSGTGTSNVLRIEMFGIVAALLWLFIRSSARKSLVKENASLKVECERLAAAAS